ncbi:MAG TPA: sugar phosphate nucleotidyltransferase [Candidatus Paceibacterota bacterium]
MHAIILVAGKGTRMRELTLDKPKPMLSYKGKNLIEHKLDALPDAVTDIILIVGYLGDIIRAHFGSSYKGRPITYVEQKELLGSAHSLWQARQHIHGPFMVLMGDDLYAKEDLAELARHSHALIASETGIDRSGGKMFLNENGTVRDIIEDKDGSIKSPLSYTGACVLSPEIFEYKMVQIPGRSEFGLPQTLLQMRDRFPFKLVRATFWKQITSPEDLT